MRKNTLLDGATVLLNGPGIVEDNVIDGSISAGGDGAIIRRNRFRGGSEGRDGRPASAIEISGSGTAIVEDNEIIDSLYGIDIHGGATPQVGGNTIHGSTITAILVDLGTAPTIEGNTIEANRTGIDVRVTATPVLTGNTLCGNEIDLKVPAGSTLTLEGNTVCTDPASTAP